MRQAIEEGFILDVLKNYTTYKTYYRLIKSVEDDPEVDKKKAAQALARFMQPAPAQHRPEDRGDDRALPRSSPATRSAGGRRRWWSPAPALHAVRYKQAFDKYIEEKGYTDIKTLVAFSGTVIDPDDADRSTPRSA